MRLHPRTRNVLAWLLWLATMACCAAGLVVTLLVTRPLTAGVLAEGAFFAVAFPLGYATIGLVLWFATMLAALVSLVLRFRSSRGTERQQLRWIAAGATGAVIGLLVGMSGVVVTYFAVLCVPVGVAVAVLRYRLWDLDRLVSRTVTYTVVTALLLIPYLLVLPAATRLAGRPGSLAVAAATLGPLHAELLGVVDATMQPTHASLWLRPPAVTPRPR